MTNHWLKSEVEKTTQNMGSGGNSRLFGKDVIFPRQFRFTFSPSIKPEVSLYVLKVTPNFAWKSLDLELYDLPDKVTYEWVLACTELAKAGSRDQTAEIKFFDGCGTLLYGLKFTGLILVNHEMPLDYSSNLPVTHHLTLEYLKLDRL